MFSVVYCTRKTLQFATVMRSNEGLIIETSETSDVAMVTPRVIITGSSS